MNLECPHCGGELELRALGKPPGRSPKIRWDLTDPIVLFVSQSILGNGTGLTKTTDLLNEKFAGGAEQFTIYDVRRILAQINRSLKGNAS